MALRIVLVVAAVWALRRELVGLTARDLLLRLKRYGGQHMLLGVACTVGSFVVLGLIEVLAVRASRPSAGDTSDAVPTSAAMTTAFVANAFSQSIGLSLVTASAVRAREYVRFGLGVASIARVTALVTLTTTLGLLIMSAWALLTMSTPLRLHTTDVPLHAVGALLAIIVVGYFAWVVFGESAARQHGRWTMARPSPGVAVIQGGLSILDWMLAGTVLFAFTPTSLGIGYVALIRAYIISQAVGTLSHVPGGAGVLEIVLLLLLTRNGSAAAHTAVVASLVMFRLVYYVLPLLAAMTTAGVAELRRSIRATRAIEAAHVG